MNSLAQHVYLGELVLVGGFWATVFGQLLTGRIPLHGLLEGDVTWDPERMTEFSPGRAQLLMSTLFSALYCLLQTLHDPGAVLRIPPQLVAIQAASQVSYLAGKAYALLFKSSGGIGRGIK